MSSSTCNKSANVMVISSASVWPGLSTQPALYEGTETESEEERAGEKSIIKAFASNKGSVSSKVRFLRA
eukprot:6214271-Pleurochrysis_carterae.AAC.1